MLLIGKTRFSMFCLLRGRPRQNSGISHLGISHLDMGRILDNGIRRRDRGRY
jgi:hypothetical protein